MNETASNPAGLWLARYAKLVVAMTFLLIFIGGYTTTSGAGMAFPDWPLSHDSLNPDGWWANFMQRLEHGHRLTAETVGLLIGILCAWVWGKPWSVPLAVAGSALLSGLGVALGASRPVLAHLGLWGSAILFGLALLWPPRQERSRQSATLRWFAFAAFLGVLIQAVMGGLRVTIESSGDASLATTFRVLHGCFAQLELGLLVGLAGMLSPAWQEIVPQPTLRGVAWLGWFSVVMIFGQLIVGASMRHLGAGLAIPSFPRAAPDGGWLPQVHNTFVDLNFTHTRVGALVVTVCVILLVLRALQSAAGDARIVRPALLLIVLLAVQITLGLQVVWQLRPPILTTLHVLNGAALLATTVLLAARATRAGRSDGPRPRAVSAAHFTEVAA